jgi:protein SCO1/2
VTAVHRYLPKSRIARTTAILSALASLALVGAVAWTVWLDEGARQPMGQQASAGRAIGGPFELTDATGATVTAQDLHGSYSLVFFGYTHCPDVCPMTLRNVSQALDAVAEAQPAKAKAVQPVFITLDPKRDDVARMRDYVANFHPRLIGLTGDPAAVERAADAYHVAYEKVDPDTVQAAGGSGAGGGQAGEHAGKDHASMDHASMDHASMDHGGGDAGAGGQGGADPGAYLMQHSSYVFLMGPDGRHVAHVAHSAGAPRIAAMIRDHVAP